MLTNRVPDVFFGKKLVGKLLLNALVLPSHFLPYSNALRLQVPRFFAVKLVRSSICIRILVI